MNRSNSSESRLYVGNLPQHVKAREIEDVFAKYGKINDVDVKQPHVGRGPAFAFLEFEDRRDAEDAIHGRDGYDFDGQRIRVQFPRSSEGGRSNSDRDRSSSYRGGGGGGYSGRGRGGGRGRGRGGGPPMRTDYRVLVSGLPPTGSWQDMKDHMREAGQVTYADVFRDGTGVVEFVKYDDMKWAVKNLDNTKFKSHEGETSFVRLKIDGMRQNSKSRSRSRSRSRSPPRRRRRSYSRSRSRSRSPYRS